MSAAPLPSKPATGTASAPLRETLEAINTLCENQRVLTATELRLALILIRRGAHREPVKVSNSNWTAWTGLDPKSRELAIRGLRNKGFHIDGRGDRAQFRFDRRHWLEYVAKSDRASRPKVEQKRVPAKPAQMIHPDCRDNGCMMARTQEQQLIQIDSRGGFAALVDPAGATSVPGHHVIPMNRASGQTHHSLVEDGTFDATRECVPAEARGRSTSAIAQPSDVLSGSTSAAESTRDNQESGELCQKLSTTISKTTTKTVKKPNTSMMTTTSKMTKMTTKMSPMNSTTKTTNDFPQAFARMVSLFPTVGAAFLAALLELLPADVMDHELTAALVIKRNQHSEALWLRTVPTIITNMRAANRERADIQRNELLKLRAEAVSANDQETVYEVDRLLNPAT